MLTSWLRLDEARGVFVFSSISSAKTKDKANVSQSKHVLERY